MHTFIRTFIRTPLSSHRPQSSHLCTCNERCASRLKRMRALRYGSPHIDHMLRHPQGAIHTDRSAPSYASSCTPAQYQHSPRPSSHTPVSHPYFHTTPCPTLRCVSTLLSILTTHHPLFTGAFRRAGPRALLLQHHGAGAARPPELRHLQSPLPRAEAGGRRLPPGAEPHAGYGMVGCRGRTEPMPTFPLAHEHHCRLESQV